MTKSILAACIVALIGLGLHPDRASAAPLVSGSNQATMGVTLTVTTSGFEFTPLIGVLINPGGGTSPLPPQVVNVSVALRNHTAMDIPFALQLLGGSNSERFIFKVYNSNGDVVWDSTGGLAIPTVMKMESLKAGHAWKQTVSVPLFINGVSLPAGVYTLSASLAGTPQFSTITSFQVNNVIAVN